MLLELSPFIEGDLDHIAKRIAQDNPRRAVTFIQDIRPVPHGMGKADAAIWLFASGGVTGNGRDSCPRGWGRPAGQGA